MTKLYVTGLWIIEDWNKKTPELYLQTLKKTLKMLQGEKLLFLSNQKNIFDLVREFSESQDISLETVSMPVQNLPAVLVSDNYVKACQRMQLAISPKSSWNNYRTIQEKGIKHYFRDYNGKSVDSYKKVLSIWLSKVPLLADIASRKEYSEFKHFAWCDASVARFNPKRIKSNFIKQEDKSGKISHYYSGMKYYSQIIPVSASYMSGDRSAWESFNLVYTKYLKILQDSSYAHDEETVISHCHEECAELFHLINPEQRARNLRRKQKKTHDSKE